MAKTIGFGNLEREMLSNDCLPTDVRMAIAEFKQILKNVGNLKDYVHHNKENGLPQAAVGLTYYEHQVGWAHPGDKEPRGKRRLVALVDPTRKILKMYFTDAHYTLGQWQQLQYP